MATHTYTVRGHWPFPTDMLRHDGSRAASASDQSAIARLSTEHAEAADAFDDVEINLIADWKPNSARWESFGWAVPSDQDWAMEKVWRAEALAREALAESAIAKLTPAELDALLAMKGRGQ